MVYALLADLVLVLHAAFILLSFIYPEGLTRPMQIAMGVGVIVITALVYGVSWRRQR